MNYPIEEDIFYIFTDGASRSVFNPKLKRKTWRHGWKGVLAVYLDEKWNPIENDRSDRRSHTRSTNQDMELWSCVDAFTIACKENFDEFRKLMIVTDSMFIYNNRKNAFYWNRVRKSWKTVYWDPVVHKKERKELAKYMKKIPIRIDFDRVKGHKDNEYNNKADKLAGQWAESKTRILWNNSEVRKKFFKKTIWFKKCFMPVQWQEVLIHIYLSRYMEKWRFRYNYEIISQIPELFMNAGWIYYDKSTLSAEFIYLVRIKDDGSNQIEEILDKYTKEEIREKMINNGIDKDIFFWKEEKNINPSIQKTCKTK